MNETPHPLNRRECIVHNAAVDAAIHRMGDYNGEDDFAMFIGAIKVDIPATDLDVEVEHLEAELHMGDDVVLK